MDRKKLLIRQAYLILFILALNFLAHKFYWYYSIWYFDMIMHFLGGLWAGLATFYFLNPAGRPLVAGLKMMAAVLAIGIGWEIFEMLVNEIIISNPFDVLDTSSDLLLDMAGGSFAALYFFRTILLRKENKLQ